MMLRTRIVVLLAICSLFASRSMSEEAVKASAAKEKQATAESVKEPAAQPVKKPAASTPPKAANAESVPGLQAEKPDSGIFVETDQGYMTPYVQTIPGTDVSFEMIPIPGGTFKLGSPESEPGRNEDEGPQVEIELQPFWLAKHEVTWAEYKQFMGLYPQFKQFEKLRLLTSPGHEHDKAVAAIKEHKALEAIVKQQPSFVDAVTCPTPLYYPEVTFESGEDPQQPAVTMTPYAARQYTKWMSAITRQTFRLPSEAEWEYAARAGSATPYYFGDKAEQLGEYAWYAENSDDKSQMVGKKKPNAWGLHDMLGNVAEMVLDQYAADHYAKLKELHREPMPSAEAILWPNEQFPRVVRGGSWLDEPAACRCAARLATDDMEWKMSDPNLPHSPWWYTELYPTGGVGFRIARPLAPMSEELQKKCWEIDAERLQGDVDARVEEGRGILGIVGPELTEAIKQLEQPQVQEVLE